MIEDDEEAPITLKERKALRERAQSMAEEQKGVERRIARRSSDDTHPPRKSKSSARDWEFI